MKKMQLLIVLPLIMAFLALVDYLVTHPALELPDPSKLKLSASEVDASTNSISAPKQNNLTQAILTSDLKLKGYSLEKSTRSSELFDSLALSNMKVTAYKNNLQDPLGINPSLTIYELNSTPGQGTSTFLNLKLALTDQLSSQSEINATNQYGQASFFYNNASNPSTGFLLVQITDTIFGFKYPKNSPIVFQFIQNFIKSAANSNT